MKKELKTNVMRILEKEKVEIARKVIDEALGGINNPNTGIMFGFDLAFVDGLNN